MQGDSLPPLHLLRLCTEEEVGVKARDPEERTRRFHQEREKWMRYAYEDDANGMKRALEAGVGLGEEGKWRIAWALGYASQYGNVRVMEVLLRHENAQVNLDLEDLANYDKPGFKTVRHEMVVQMGKLESEYASALNSFRWDESEQGAFMPRLKNAARYGATSGPPLSAVINGLGHFKETHITGAAALAAVRLLLEYGADPEVKGFREFTPITFTLSWMAGGYGAYLAPEDFDPDAPSEPGSPAGPSMNLWLTAGGGGWSSQQQPPPSPPTRARGEEKKRRDMVRSEWLEKRESDQKPYWRAILQLLRAATREKEQRELEKSRKERDEDQDR